MKLCVCIHQNVCTRIFHVQNTTFETLKISFESMIFYSNAMALRCLWWWYLSHLKSKIFFEEYDILEDHSWSSWTSRTLHLEMKTTLSVTKKWRLDYCINKEIFKDSSCDWKMQRWDWFYFIPRNLWHIC